MSAATPPQTPNANPGDKPGANPSATAGIVITVALVAVVVLYGLFSGASGIRLDRSPAGFEGLALWLESQDVEARMFRGGDSLTEERVGLRVLGLHDADLEVAAPRAETKRERLRADTQREIFGRIVVRKAESLPSLVILPKWRAGVGPLGVAHPELLIDAESVARVFNQIVPREPGSAPTLIRSDGWVDRGWRAPQLLSGNRLLALYHPQMIRGAACETLIGRDDAMLLGRCALRDRTVLVLTDPDLMNNHGLAQADNDDIALSIIKRFADDKPVLVDVTTQLWTSFGGGRAPERQREWSELWRFFEPPFTALWLALGLMTALAFWRSWVRDRAPIPPEADGVEASRQAAIDAKARLLRLSGHDAELTRAHIADRIQALAAEVLGPHRAAGAAGVAQLRRAVARRAAPLALQLDEFSRPDLPRAEAPLAELLAHLDRFDAFASQVRAALGAKPSAPGAAARDRGAEQSGSRP